MSLIQKVGWNINGASLPPTKDRFFDFWRKLEPTTSLVMDSYDLAVGLKSASPKTLITHRSYSTNEGTLWQTETAANWVTRETVWKHPEIIRHYLNEPPTGDPRLISTSVEVGNRCVDAGYGVVLDNFAVGSFSPEQIESGYYDPLLKLCCVPDNRVYLGAHSYTGILMPFGVGQWTIEQLFDKSRCQPANWPTPEQIPLKRWNGALPPYWHLRRTDWFILRAREKGYGELKVWETESGLDALPDLGNQGVYNYFRNTYGVPSPFTSMRGVNTLRNVYAAYFPQWSFQRAVFEQWKWYVNMLTEHTIGTNPFTITNAYDWKIGAGTDYSELFELFDLILAEKQAPPPAPIPVPGDVPFPTSGFEPVNIIPLYNNINLRKQPKIADNVVRVIEDKAIGEIAAQSAVLDGAYKWYPIKVSGVEGWLRNDVFTWTAYIPPDDSITVTLTPTERAAIKSIASKL